VVAESGPNPIVGADTHGFDRPSPTLDGFEHFALSRHHDAADLFCHVFIYDLK
jgi:hypothetical protein